MRRFKIRIGREDLVDIGGGFSHDRGVLVDISQYKAQLAALPLAEQISRAA